MRGIDDMRKYMYNSHLTSLKTIHISKKASFRFTQEEKKSYKCIWTTYTLLCVLHLQKRRGNRRTTDP